MSAILRENVPPPSERNPEVAPALDRVVARCLDKQPEGRFQSARDVAFALEAFSGVSSVARMEALQAAPRRLWRLGAALAATLAAGTVSGLFAARPLWDRPAPTFTQLTFRRGYIDTARFAPDSQTVVYSACFDGHRDSEPYRRIGSDRTTFIDGTRLRRVACRRGAGRGFPSCPEPHRHAGTPASKGS